MILGAVAWWASTHLALGRGAAYDDASEALRRATWPRGDISPAEVTEGAAWAHYKRGRALCEPLDFSALSPQLALVQRALGRAAPDDVAPLLEPGSREMPEACQALGVDARTEDVVLVQLDAGTCEVIQRCRPAFSHYRTGARAATAMGPNALWNAEDSEPLTPFEPTRLLRTQLWLIDAYIRRADDEIADVLRFTGDLGTGAPYAAQANPIQKVALQFLWAIVPTATDAELARWATELERVEARSQRIQDAATNTWIWGAAGLIGGDRHAPPRAEIHRQLPSHGDPIERIAERVALNDEMNRWSEALEVLDRPWPEREAEYDRLERKGKRSLFHPPISIIRTMRMWDRELTIALARLRAHRVALGWLQAQRAGAPFEPSLNDPFTGQRFVMKGDRVASPAGSPEPVEALLPGHGPHSVHSP